MKKLLLILFSLITSFLYATPSTQIWNPSTDIQKTKTFHLGIDNYVDESSNLYCIGLTYGLFKNFEIGFDITETSKIPLSFNAKYALPETKMPAIAVGIMGYGTVTDSNADTNETLRNDLNIGYALIAKTFYIGRFTIGGYTGNPDLLKNKDGSESSGIIVSYDRYFSKKIWASIDYASGNNGYGSLSPGFSYAFTDNISVIFGVVFFNQSTKTQATTQLDINF